MGTGAKSQSTSNNPFAKALGVTNANEGSFGTDSAQLNHGYLPWKSGWSGNVDRQGAIKSLSLRSAKNEVVNGINCLVLENTNGNGPWTTRWFARDKEGTIWLVRERRGQRLVDLQHPFLPKRPEVGWKSWTDASAIPDEYVVLGSLAVKIRLHAGEILNDCIRLIVHTYDGVRVEYYAKDRGLVKIENP